MLLEDAVKDNSTLKVSIRGDSGSGKSYTAACLAIAIQKYIKSDKPISWWDTEDKVAYVLGHFKHNDIKVKKLTSRLFTDAATFFKEAEMVSDVAVIDSLTHLWENIINTYLKQTQREFMRVWDWSKVKPPWREIISDKITGSPLHLIICGRVSDIFTPVEIDRDTVIVASGTKMSAEKSTEYEAALTLEMKKFTISEEELKQRARAIKYNKPLSEINKTSLHRMTIIKDSANLLSGSMFVFKPDPGNFIEPDNPVFRAIKPFIDFLEIGAKHKGVDASRQAEQIFNDPDDSYTEKRKQKDIKLEELFNLMTKHFASSREEKKKGFELLEKVFGTNSKKGISAKSLSEINNGYDLIWAELNPEGRDEAGSGGNEGPLTSPAPQGSLEGVGRNKPRDTSEPAEDHTAQEVNRKMGLVDYPENEDPLGINGLLARSKFDEAWEKLDGYKA